MRWPAGDPWKTVHDYGWFALRFGWTPEQVDRLPAFYEARLPQYAQAWDEVVAERRKS